MGTEIDLFLEPIFDSHRPYHILLRPRAPARKQWLIVAVEERKHPANQNAYEMLNSTYCKQSQT